jgi:hypothetical protein
MEDTDKQQKKHQGTNNLIPYMWKKGQSGNPNGRPKGKTLKEFAREYLESLPDDEKIDYLASLPTEIVWKMAEGNPQTDVTSKGEQINPMPILGNITNVPTNDSNQEDSKPQ